MRHKADEKPVIAALVPKGAAILPPEEVETVPGPGGVAPERLRA
jgi:hypothetical protein